MLNVTAQENGVYSYDGFFSATEQTSAREESDGQGLFTPMLPGRDVFENQDGDNPTPVGSGLLLLAGMGAVYALRKSKRQ